MAMCICRDFELREQVYALWVHDREWWLLRDGKTYDNIDLKMSTDEIDAVCSYIERWGRR